MKKVLVPKVRFKGFSEEWKEEKLENIYSFASEGGTPDTNKDIYYKPGLFYFTKIEDMANKYIYNTKSKISELGLKNSSAWIIPKNNILFSNGATIGNVSINKVDLSTKQGIVGMIIKKKFNLEFIYYLLKSENFQSKLAEKITVGTIPTVAIFNLKKIKLLLTTNSIEQQKIGKLLDQISNLITIEQSKLNKLKQLKQTLLQKMFPEGNSKVPRIRFKGFEGEWEEEKLDDIFKVITGGEPPKNYKNSKHPVGMYKYPIYSNGQEANAIWGFSDNYSINTEAITISSIGTIGFPVVRKMFFTPIIRLKTLLPYNKNMNINFLNLSVSQINFSFNQAGIPSMNSNQLKDNIILISRNFSEQQKIGDFFSKIDTLINLYNSKLNKLKQIKKALINKMLL
ncbi:restriction endonuclease subunit S [Mycoplasmopsis felis]|uniref:restriction endonuclease subunit S n=1 Tax=Mycoplasmopsis felis TaxID=33923 RepID=UPI002AFE2756|nr:restriction endonuclease subunit S [Mycoplasmopsis felis]WQQ04370.1 restriction endonuclease subunit S [Mycoplasmopsis felis]